MKIVVIQNDWEESRGPTELLLAAFEEGLRESEAQVTHFQVERLKIGRCRHCKKCVYKTPGICYQRDDGQTVLAAMRQAELWIFATSTGRSAPLENLIDRLLPLAQVTSQNGRKSRRKSYKIAGWLRATLQSGKQSPHQLQQDNSAVAIRANKLVLVSSSKDQKLEDFNPIVRRLQALATDHGRVFAGALIHPRAQLNGAGSYAEGLPEEIASAAYKAGEQLVQEGTIHAENLAIVRREIDPEENTALVNNRVLQQVPVSD